MAVATCGAVIICVAQAQGKGSYFDAGPVYLLMSLVATLVAVAGWPRIDAIERHGAGVTQPLLMVGLSVLLWHFIGWQPLAFWELGRHTFATYNHWTASAAIVGITALGLPPQRWTLYFSLLLALHAGIGVWVLLYSPSPQIDVWVQAQAACEAFSRGVNPYTITFPNIYGNEDRLFYPPGISYDGVVHFGYQYMPLTFIASYASWLLTGDVRFGGLLAMELAALFIGLCGREPFARLAACLLLFFPSIYLVIENAWTEPYVACCLAATVYCAMKHPRLFPWVLGLLLVSKQHMPLAALSLPLVTGFSWRAIWRVAWRAAVVGAAITLPLALWDPAAFYRGVFWVQLHNPLRMDALSLTSWLVRQTGTRPPPMVEVVAALVGAAIALRFAPRTPAGFVLGVAGTFIPLFVFGKQAFTNYWFFSVAVLALAVSALSRDLRVVAADEEVSETAVPFTPAAASAGSRS